MKEIRQIIVPVDFHQHTSDLAEFAINIANKLGGKVTFVHAIELIEYYQDLSIVSAKEIDADLKAKAEVKMNALLEKCKPMAPNCSGTVIMGDTADSIVEFAQSKEADMIIMGTHGARGIEKILLGSVAERVLKRAHCPTLTFNPYKGERGYKITSSINEVIQPL